MTSEEIKAGLISGEVRAVVLYGADPLRDFPDTEAGARPSKPPTSWSTSRWPRPTPPSSRMWSSPLESHAEKDGTITHTEGRLQRVRPAAARPRDIRGGWHVLAELSAALGHETNIHAVPEALRAINTEVVPFYAGLTDAEIGGRGIRWRDRSGIKWLGGVRGSTRTGLRRGFQGTPRTPPPRPGGRRWGSDGTPGEVRPAEPQRRPPHRRVDPGTYRDLWANSTTDLSPAELSVPAQGWKCQLRMPSGRAVQR